MALSNAKLIIRAMVFSEVVSQKNKSLEMHIKNAGLACTFVKYDNGITFDQKQKSDEYLEGPSKRIH